MPPPKSVGAGCSTRVCKHFKLVFRCAAVDCSTARFRGLPRLRLIVRSQMPPSSSFFQSRPLDNPRPRSNLPLVAGLRVWFLLQRIHVCVRVSLIDIVSTSYRHRVTSRPSLLPIAPDATRRDGFTPFAEIEKFRTVPENR